MEFDTTLGALFVGYALAWGLFGVLCMQTFSYFQKFPKDRAWLKILVIVLWYGPSLNRSRHHHYITYKILDTLQLVLLGHGLYYWLIKNYSHPAALINSVWSLNVAVLVTNTIVLLVQLFLTRRLFVLSNGNWFLSAILIMLSFTYYALGIAAEVKAFQVEKVSLFYTFRDITIAGLASSATVDLVLAMSLCFYLIRSRTGVSTTDTIVKNLVLYAMTTGLLTSIIVLIDMASIQFLTMPGNLVHLAFNIVAGKLYSNSLLASLNFREALRNTKGMNTFNLSTVNAGQSVTGLRFQTSGTNNTSTAAEATQNSHDVTKDAVSGMEFGGPV
ncbi:hypothetical protein C8J57DRAFT_1579673 [Mycena rebaudengoi]|nr:hypothetical protein C8J57DRAFT_1579673 [Mycena rebaudengoi]